MYAPKPKIKISADEHQVRITLPRFVVDELKLHESIEAEIFIDDWREKEEDEPKKCIVIVPIKGDKNDP